MLNKIERGMIHIIGIIIWLVAGNTKLYSRVASKLNKRYLEIL